MEKEVVIYLFFLLIKIFPVLQYFFLFTVRSFKNLSTTHPGDIRLDEEYDMKQVLGTGLN
jgi:hypothetical protein